jgi:DNA-binding transcriptional MerR regulator
VLLSILEGDMSLNELFTVGSAAKQAGVSRQSLQYYLMVGILTPTETTPTGRRMFDSKAIERIKIIKKLNESGYPLRAIRDLFMQDKTHDSGNHRQDKSL